MKDRYFRLLANKHRRCLLRALQDEKSHSVPTREQDARETKLTMFHVHLPLLEDAGLIGWNREAHTITRGGNYTEIEPMIEFLNSYPVPSSD